MTFIVANMESFLNARQGKKKFKKQICFSLKDLRDGKVAWKQCLNLCFWSRWRNVWAQGLFLLIRGYDLCGSALLKCGAAGLSHLEMSVGVFWLSSVSTGPATLLWASASLCLFSSSRMLVLCPTAHVAGRLSTVGNRVLSAAAFQGQWRAAEQTDQLWSFRSVYCLILCSSPEPC